MATNEMVRVDRALAQTIKRSIPAITEDGLRDHLGISENTWRKIRDGAPIRKSTLARILTRIDPGQDRAGDAGRARARSITGHREQGQT